MRRADGALFSTLYGDVCKSRAGARAEALAVFVHGCDLPARWRAHAAGEVRERDGSARGSHFTLLEIGFGAGVNFVETALAFEAHGASRLQLHYVAIEKHPLARDDLAIALDDAAAPPHWRDALLERWPLPVAGVHRLEFPSSRIRLWLVLGDVLDWLPRLSMPVDACYVDGFAPARNPEPWSTPVCRAIARLARPGATLASYSAAGAFRDALAQSGFDVRRLTGFGGKRHRIEATYAPRWTVRRRAHAWHDVAVPGVDGERRAAVVGAGLAGAAVAAALGRRGWAVDVYDAREAPARGGSAQPWCVDHLHVSPDDNLLARLTRQALLDAHALTWTGRRASEAIGRLVLAADAAEAARWCSLVERAGLPSAFVDVVDASEASARAGVPIAHAALWLALAGAQSPAQACARWLDAAGDALARRMGERVVRIAPTDDGAWQIASARGTSARYAAVVLANADAAPALAGLARPALRRVGGQTTLVAGGALARLRCALGGQAYACPAGDGVHALVGATFDDDPGEVPDARADASNLARLARVLNEPAIGAPVASFRGHRAVAPDRLPLIGPIVDEARVLAAATAHARDDRLPLPRARGLVGAFAYGSRGLLWAPWAAELVAALLDGEPIALPRELLDAVDPARFVRRGLRAPSKARR